jgi:hypothetical protein
MTEEDKVERKPSVWGIKGMSLYASSADYERRLSEDIPEVFALHAVDETPEDTAKR